MKIRLNELRKIIHEAVKGASSSKQDEKLFQDLRQKMEKVEAGADRSTLLDAISLMLKSPDEAGEMTGRPLGLSYEDVYNFVNSYVYFTRGDVITGDKLLKVVRQKVSAARKSGDEDAVDDTENYAKEMMSLLAKASTALSKLKVDEEPAPPSAPLGKFAFPNNRRRRMVPEPNTELESKLYDELVDHFAENTEMDEESAAVLRRILKAGLYEKIFSEPKQKDVYRGMGVSKDWLASKLNVGADKVPDRGEKEVKMTFKPNFKATSSWTTSRSIADGFASDIVTSNRDQDDQFYKVVLHARVGDNPGKFIVASPGLYGLDHIADFSMEKEALSLGPVVVYKISWELY